MTHHILAVALADCQGAVVHLPHGAESEESRRARNLDYVDQAFQPGLQPVALHLEHVGAALHTSHIEDTCKLLRLYPTGMKKALQKVPGLAVWRRTMGVVTTDLLA